MSDYEKLTDRELDEMVAEKVMGLVVIQPPFSPVKVSFPKGTVASDETERLWRQTYPGGQHIPTVPHYSTNDNAARLVRDRIAELGLIPQFLNILESRGSEGEWDMMQCSPIEQCRAALMTLEAKP